MTDRPGRVRLTVAQALVRFLAHQWTQRDGVRHRAIVGCFGILGHGNVAGIGEALLRDEMADGHTGLPFVPVRNEQAGVHAAAAFARTTRRLQTWAVTTSIGPGATNLVTGAALATTNRLPVLLLPADTFATRRVDPALQQLEDPRSNGVSVNDALAPVCRYWDRVHRPEQLLPAVMSVMRVLTDPADTGACTLCLPQDVQAEAWDWPLEAFADRVWDIARPVPEPEAVARAVRAIRACRRPLIVAGGGVAYSEADGELRHFVASTGIPVADTQAGKGTVEAGHALSVGGLGVTGSRAANQLAAQADLVIGIGTRYCDFTTASRSVFANPEVAFVNLNVAPVDAAKHAAIRLVADARAGLAALLGALSGWHTEPAYRNEAIGLAEQWRGEVAGCVTAADRPLPAQSEIIGVLNELLGPDDVVINAAGSMPGQLQALWQAQSSRQYHVEYAYSCMGYEIPAAMGVRLAVGPQPRVVALVGDGSYAMMPADLATLVAEGLAAVIVLLDNHGYASIGGLSEQVGSQRFGTADRMRNRQTGRRDGPRVPLDLAANAASWGAEVLRCDGMSDFRANLVTALAAAHTTVVYIQTDPTAPGPPTSAWWDVPVAEVSELASVRTARAGYERERQAQRGYLTPTRAGEPAAEAGTP